MAYELTTKARVRAYSGLSDITNPTDALLDQLIDAVTAEIERICQKGIMSRAYTEWLDGPLSGPIQLSQWPIISFYRVSDETVRVINAQCSLTDTDEAFIEVDNPTTLVRTTVTSGASVGSLDYSTAAQPTVGQLATAITAVAGWTASALSAYTLMRTSLLRPCGRRECLDSPAYLEAPYAALADYSVIYDTGELRLDAGRFLPGIRNVYVNYTAGYATAPEDIQQLADELVTQMYHDGRRDGALQSETLGDYSWTAAADSGKTSAEIMTRLAPYMARPLGV